MTRAAHAMHHGAPVRAREPRTRPIVVSSRFRCREHPDVAVTRAGAGCPACDTHDQNTTAAHVVIAVDSGPPSDVVVAFVQLDSEPTVRVRYRPEHRQPWACTVHGLDYIAVCPHTSAAQKALETAATRRRTATAERSHP